MMMPSFRSKRSPERLLTSVFSRVSSIVGAFNPIIGPVLKVGIIKLNPDGTPISVVGGEQNLNLFDALLDTGATSTCISERVVMDVGLVPTGKTIMTGAT